MLTLLRDAWTYFRNIDEHEIFHVPFDPPGYREMIKQPIDLQTIEGKLAYYNSIDELDQDLRLMLKNCVDFNKGKWGEQYAGKISKTWARQLPKFQNREVSILLNEDDDEVAFVSAVPVTGGGGGGGDGGTVGGTAARCCCWRAHRGHRTPPGSTHAAAAAHA